MARHRNGDAAIAPVRWGRATCRTIGIARAVGMGAVVARVAGLVRHQ